MSRQITDTLKRPDGSAYANVTVRFVADQTSADSGSVVQHSDATTTTDASGALSVELQNGVYLVYVDDSRTLYLGKATITTGADATLAEVLGASASVTSAILAAVESAVADRVKYVTDLAALRAVTGMQANQAVEMVTTGRAGLFRWDSSDLSAEVAADTQMGIYVPPTGQDGSSGAWVRQYGQTAQIAPTVRAEWFGATGDGSTDDATAISAALSFGSKRVELAGGTYVFGASLTIPANTILDLNGSTLFHKASTGDVSVYVSAGAKLQNGVIDGNKANQLPIGTYTAGTYWTHYCEVYLEDDRATMENVLVKNAASEGVTIRGRGSWARDCVVMDCGGNAWHHSGSDQTQLINCGAMNTNLTSGTGHEDGAFVFSNSNYDAAIMGCWAYNVGLYVIGSIDAATNARIVVNGMRAVTANGILDSVSPTEAPTEVVISDSIFTDCGRVLIDNTFDDATSPSKFTFSGCHLTYTTTPANTPFSVSSSTTLKFIGSTITAPTGGGVLMMELVNIDDIDLSGSTITGGAYGIYYSEVASPTTQRTKLLHLKGFRCVDQDTTGVRIQSNSTHSATIVVEGDVYAATSTTGYDGILIRGKCKAANCNVRIDGGTGTGIELYDDAIVTNCRVVVQSGGNSIFNPSSTTAVIRGNQVSKAIRNDGGATAVSDNDVV